MSANETSGEKALMFSLLCRHLCSVILAALIITMSLALLQGCKRKSQPPERETKLADSTPVSQKTPTAEDPIKAIRSAKSVHALAPFIAAADILIRREAVLRLGEIGGPEAVKALGEIFQDEPRSGGTDIDAGVRAAVVKTLGKLGTPDARAALLNGLQGWMRAGPQASGDYAHIYDQQYFAVAVAAIKALEPYDDQEIQALVRSIADDSSLFYALREAAWRTSLLQEMTRKGLKEPGERAAFLLSQIEPEGVLVEDRWTGKKPGEKTSAALRESVLENLVRELGWRAAEPLQEVLQNNPSREPRRALAAARMLADLVLSDFRTMKSGTPEARHRDAILTAVGALAALPQEALTPETGSQIFGQLVAAGEGLNDEGVWKALQELAPKITIPNAWTGEAPGAQEIGVALPSDLVFVPEYSRRVSGPPGVLVEACYLSPLTGPELVGRLESATGKTATKSERGSGDSKETLWTIELQSAPPEFAGVLTFGVMVQERTGGYSQRLLGRPLRKGNTLICARRIVPQ